MGTSKVKIVAEIGINHNGYIGDAQKMIDVAAVAGCDAVKLQKRNPYACVPEDQKNKPKRVPWRKEETTYLQYKLDTEFSMEEYHFLHKYAKEKGIDLFASVWDISSARDMMAITNVVKIPSAKITDMELLEFCNDKFSLKLMSTGMSTQEEIDRAVKVFEPNVIFHTNSVYPSPIKDLNFGYIRYLMDNYSSYEIGYSNHYFGLVPMFAAVAMGCTWIEFHITLDRYSWGSDQLSSVEPAGVFKLVKGIRDIEMALDKGFEPRTLYPGEEKKRDSLRG